MNTDGNFIFMETFHTDKSRTRVNMTSEFQSQRAEAYGKVGLAIFLCGEKADSGRNFLSKYYFHRAVKPI